VVAVLSMSKPEFSRLEVRLPAEVRTLALSIVRFPVLSGSAFRPGGSANGIPKLPPGFTKIAAPMAGR